MTMPALFLAAGFGTRMRPLTDNRPKPLLRVGETTLLDHALDLGRDAGLGPMVVNAHYLASQIEVHLDGTEVRVSLESPEILDSGGALKAALPILGGDPVFTMNTDAVWSGPNPFNILRQAWQPARMDILMLLAPKSRVLGHDGPGDFVRSGDGHLTKGQGEVYLGLQLVRTGPFADHPKDVFGMWDIWTKAMKDRRLFGAPYPGLWCDVGHPGSIPIAENLLRGSDV